MNRHYIKLLFLFLVSFPLSGLFAREILPISDVSNMPGDSWVFLWGTLEPVVQKDRYILRDGTGEILVSIPGAKWQEALPNPGEPALIAGELKNKANGKEIEVRYISGNGTIDYTAAGETAGLPDASWICLRGNIVKYLGKNRYLFRDSSGEAEIIIEDPVWRGLLITPESAVEVGGETRTHRGKTTITAEYIIRTGNEKAD